MSSNGRAIMAKSIYNAIAKYKAQITGKQSKLETVSITLAQTATATETASPAKNEPTASATKAFAAKKTSKPVARKTVYKVQILVGTVKLADNDRQFKGLKCERHQYGKKYTYTYGNASTMEEAKKIRKSILDKFPECYIVTFEE